MERRSIPIHLVVCGWELSETIATKGIEGEKKSPGCLAEVHSFCSYAKTPESPDKNNIPHLSDSLQGIPVKLKQFFCVCLTRIPYQTKTICCIVWMYILFQIEVMRTRAWEEWLCQCTGSAFWQLQHFGGVLWVGVRIGKGYM